MNRKRIVDEVKSKAAIAVIRMTDTKKLMKVIEAIHKGGVSIVEITITVPNALQMIKEVSSSVSKDITVGVGSVLTPEAAQKSIDAGARFVVGPIFKKAIVDVAHRSDVPAMPGCFTPTEIQSAFEAGADIVKVFPADVVGMAFFKGILAPMPHLLLMPTGGVTLTNAGDWLKAGACAVGVGSALLDKKAIEQGDYEVLTANAKTLCQSIAQGR